MVETTTRAQAAVAIAVINAASNRSARAASGRPSASPGASGGAARCHGTTATGQGIYPALPRSLSAAEYSATVRSGRKLMPSFDTGQISDADLAADYTWLTTKR